MIAARDLRERVRFQRRSEETDDGYGNEEGAFEDLFPSRAASIKPTRGMEQVRADRLQGVVSWDIWVRYDSQTVTVTNGDRIIDNRDATRVWNIKAPGMDMDGRRRWLLFQCVSGVVSG